MLMENAPKWKDKYINQGMAEGRKEGMAKGRKEGMAKGMAKGKGQLLQDLLEDRFGSLPDSVTSYIDKYSDSDALRKFALFATKAASLQAVIDQIKILTGTKCPGQTVPHA